MPCSQRNFIHFTTFVKMCGDQGRKEKLIYEIAII